MLSKSLLSQALCLLTVCSAGALALPGCGSDAARTQVTLYVDADAAVRADTVTMRVEFFEPGATEPLLTELVPMTEWPVTFALIQGQTEDFVAHVFALNSTNGVVAEGAAWTSFVSGSTRFYYMFLTPTPCSDAMIAACDDDEVCTNGGGCEQVGFTEGSALPAPPADGQSPDPCTSVTCGTSATCAARNGVGVCECNTGFAGDPLTECIDVCGQASAPDCGANGACVANDAGEPVCECDFPFDGDTCAACATGWTLNGGVCEGDCRGNCGAHEFCNEGLTVPICECVTGYDLLGQNCVWAGGGFNGGGFNDGEIADETAWTLVDTIIDDNEHGAGNGVAEHQLSGGCGLASLGQTIQMPTYSSAEPFVVEVGVERRAGDFDCAAAPLLRIGDTIQHLSFTAASMMPPDRIGTACLPVGGYGPDVRAALVVDAFSQGSSGSSPCFTGENPTCIPDAIDSVRIRPAMMDECPAPGTITNGTFAGATGWSITSSLNGATGFANANSGALSMSITRQCQSASGSQEVMFPTEGALSAPALRFDTNGTAGEPLLVEVVSGNQVIPWAEPIGTGAGSTATLCIPPWLQGVTGTLRFRIDNRSGTCSVDHDNAVTVDNVSFVSEPSCANNGTLLADFEDGNASNLLVVPPQSRFPSTVPYSWGTAPSGGSRAWFYNDNGNSGNVTATIMARIPVDPTGVAGPMIRLSYRVSNATQGGSLTIDPTAADTTFSGTTTMTTVSACLNRNVGGQAIPIQLRFGRTGGTAIVHQVDDIEVLLDASCP